MFLGTYAPRLDDKGRLILPARFRDDLQGGLVITKGQERCLNVYTPAGFAELTEDSGRISATDAAGRAYVRILFSGAADEVPDKQGRVTIPPRLREYANLTRDCAVIGARDHIEIWEASAWAAYEAAQEEAYARHSGDLPPALATIARPGPPPTA
ncbi:MAG: Cell division protein MraZ [uncultured Nocardioidaceae bacterium]|uniref:Transcriptional regulator MraZ n=1 Tax=uncultured Nocardioidaceae bacterium TaxID=253824 RepID=A0A6J4L322_9ACTN|nr:MAG: Cell division protein MraZ [uncultured Nocardioidaceae bacterium]